MLKPFFFEDNCFKLIDNIFSQCDRSGEKCEKENTNGCGMTPTYFTSSDKDGNGIIVVELPGVAKEAISCTFDDGKLALTAQRDLFGDPLKYSLSLRIRDDFDIDKAKLTYKDGLLTIELSQKASAAPRKLDIA